ncbi:COX aromatic rich motif-containing protein [Chloroflexota bacterium]
MDRYHNPVQYYSTVLPSLFSHIPKQSQDLLYLGRSHDRIHHR